jgi:murein DD-endopeptidase MepM/ murein hydrolase activator NlpD
MVSFFVIRSNFGMHESRHNQDYQFKEIKGKVQKGETLFDIFKKYNIAPSELFKMKEASANIHRLRKVHPGQDYKIVVDEDNRVNEFIYWIDDDNVLSISKNDDGFEAEKVAAEYERKTLHISGVIKDNLISSMNAGNDGLALAMQLSDVFAWDIDFTSDLRQGDIFKMVVEGLYLDGEFRKYGNILSAEFANNGETYKAYRFEHNGKSDYYNSEGKSLRKAFLKAPLSFRRVSSGFSSGRFHPVLKIYRPHHGLDYAAPAGTPVSAVGDGTVIFTGVKGQYGNLVIIRHPNGYRTYYGHLSKIEKNIKKGVNVQQGQIIAAVGSSGLATGPHLHYEVRIKDKPINPLSVKIPPQNFIPKKLRIAFQRVKRDMDARLASISYPMLASADKSKGVKTEDIKRTEL